MLTEKDMVPLINDEVTAVDHIPQLVLKLGMQVVPRRFPFDLVLR